MIYSIYLQFVAAIRKGAELSLDCDFDFDFNDFFYYLFFLFFCIILLCFLDAN